MLDIQHGRRNLFPTQNKNTSETFLGQIYWNFTMNLLVNWNDTA